ncbi:MAG: hypothetical protein HYS27_20045 [Deltaproteobacteria bacterium]|nr:hypothetical protein [Deltaproteobacteria bacterium]
MLALALLLSCGAPPSAPVANPLDEGWEVVGRRDGVVVYQRPHPGSPHPEVLAVGILEVPPWVAKNAVDDVEADDGMPYLAEARVLKRDERGVVIYNRVSPPLVSDRDYTIRIIDQSYTANGVTIWIARWRTANDEGPPKRSGVVRVPENDGYWRFEPVDGGMRTRASYWVYTNPGGAVPAPLAAIGSTTLMPEVMAGMAARARRPQYRAKMPPLPTRLAPLP